MMIVILQPMELQHNNDSDLIHSMELQQNDDSYILFKHNHNFKIILSRKYILFFFTVETFIRLNDYRMESTILSH
jgi:hypothetical protein